MFYRLTGKSIYIIRANTKEDALKDFNGYRITGNWESIDDALAHVDGRFYSGYGSGGMYIKLSDKAYKLTRLGKNAIKLYDILCELCLTSTEIEDYLTEDDVPVVGKSDYEKASKYADNVRELGYRPLCVMLKDDVAHVLCLPTDSRGWKRAARHFMGNCYSCLAIRIENQFQHTREIAYLLDGELLSPAEMMEHICCDKNSIAYKESRRRLKFIGADTEKAVPVYNDCGEQIEPSDSDVQLVAEVYRRGCTPYCVLHGREKTAVLTVSTETASWAKGISNHSLGCKIMPAYVFGDSAEYTSVLVWTDFGPTYVSTEMAEKLYTLPKFVECARGWNMKVRWHVHDCYGRDTVYRTEDNKFYYTRDGELKFCKCQEA